MFAPLAIAIALVLAAGPEEPIEGPRQIGLMPLQLDGAKGKTRQALEDSLRQGLLRGKVEINLFNEDGVCKTKACRDALEGVDVIVVSPEVKVSGGDYSISVGLSRMGEPGELARFDNECPACDPGTVGELIAELAAEFIASADAAEAEPEPQPVEEGPVDEPAPELPDEPKKGNKVFTPLGAAAVALGVGAVGGGAVLLALDGRNHKPSCPADQLDPNGGCPNVWTTKGAGIGTLVAGIALVGGGVGLLVVGAKRNPKDETARLRLGPGSIEFTTRF